MPTAENLIKKNGRHPKHNTYYHFLGRGLDFNKDSLKSPYFMQGIFFND